MPDNVLLDRQFTLRNVGAEDEAMPIVPADARTRIARGDAASPERTTRDEWTKQDWIGLGWFSAALLSLPALMAALALLV